ncbi:MAG: deoxyguanosinetriphosphate triphosphohydrolase [Candidatus Magnetoovum sp. WYHC-5]|nr:deoxyguanosinetriphosphate triphosphohydrolase [Candidatus Magnetoovum sp. WYHC-5]
MLIRQQIEERERQILNRAACLSVNTKGRIHKEKEGEMRTCFQRDRDRIIHSKAFRRLKHKTQVFLSPMGDHYRTRLTHVLEVSQISRTISRALGLNEDLTEAIALGHDLGHTPFGHAGEQILREIHPGGFDHYYQSLRVVDFLEKDGKGLNLTYEVRDGIFKHSKGKGRIIPGKDSEKAETLEGQVVRLSDIIAYVNHDLDDALRAGVITEQDIPTEILDVVGITHAKRIDTMVKDLVYTTLDNCLCELTMTKNVLEAINALRTFLFKKVYESERVLADSNKAKRILKSLYEYYLEYPKQISMYIPMEDSQNKHRLVCDFIACMTDRFALMKYEKIFIPEPWL